MTWLRWRIERLRRRLAPADWGPRGSGYRTLCVRIVDADPDVVYLDGNDVIAVGSVARWRSVDGVLDTEYVPVRVVLRG